MKIVIIQGAFLPIPPLLGGAVEKRWFAMGKEMARKGHEVIHISRLFRDLPTEEYIDGVLHKRVKGYDTPASGIVLKLYDLLYSLRVKRIIPKDVDAIVTNTFWAPIVFSKSQKRRCMVDVARIPKGQMRLYTGVARLKGNSSPVVAAIKKEISPAFHHKITLVPNPLPFSSNFLPDIGKKEKIILYAGRIHPEKGLDILLEAFKGISSEWKLMIIGAWDIKSGGGGINYLNSLKQLAVGTKTEFRDPEYNIEKLNRLYSTASIFVYPSVAEKGETFGLAPLEAMAWGCVPVVSALSCFQDFINDKKNGFVFNHRSLNRVEELKLILERLIADSSIRTSIASAALDVRHSHSVSLITDQFISEFDKMSKEIV